MHMKKYTAIFCALSTLILGALSGCSSQTTQVGYETTLPLVRPPLTPTVAPQPTPTVTVQSVAGRTYEGPPTGDVSRSGCEGCGNPATFEFDNNGSVRFIA